MKFHGIQLEEGSAVSNMTVASGTSFPGTPNEGELFFRSDTATTVKGLYAYIGGSWDRIASTDSLTAPSGTTLPGTANPGDLFYKNSNDGTEGLYAYNDSAWVNVSSGGSSITLGATEIAYGDGVGVVTSSSALTFNSTNSVLTAGGLTIDTGALAPGIVQITANDTLVLTPAGVGLVVQSGAQFSGDVSSTGAGSFTGSLSGLDADLAGGKVKLANGFVQQAYTTSSVSGTAGTPIDLFPLTDVGSGAIAVDTSVTKAVKMIVTVSNGTDRQMSNIDILVNGATVVMSQYGELSTAVLGSFDASVAGAGNPLDFSFTPASNGSFDFAFMVTALL